MKIQIDTVNKTVKVEESVNIGQFIEGIKKMLPDWKKFSLEAGTIIEWTSPIVIPRTYPWWTKPYQPYPWITFGTGPTTGTVYQVTQESVTAQVTEGTYCIDLQG